MLSKQEARVIKWYGKVFSFRNYAPKLSRNNIISMIKAWWFKNVTMNIIFRVYVRKIETGITGVQEKVKGGLRPNCGWGREWRSEATAPPEACVVFWGGEVVLRWLPSVVVYVLLKSCVYSMNIIRFYYESMQCNRGNNLYVPPKLLFIFLFNLLDTVHYVWRIK